MIVTSKIKMDFAIQGAPEPVRAVQDDKYSRNLEITLLSNSAAWVPPVGTTAIVRYQKPDGTVGSYDTLPDGSAGCSISSNVLTVALAPQVLTVPGPVRLAVGLIFNEAEIHTFTIRIDVQPTPGLDAQSEDYVNVSGYGRSFFEVDLTEAVALSHGTEEQSTDVTASIDGAALVEAIRAGHMVRVKVTENVPIVGSYVASILMTTATYREKDDGSFYARISGKYLDISYNRFGGAQLNVRSEDGDYVITWTDFGLETADVPVTVSADGYTDITGLRRMKSFDVIEGANTLTFNYVLEGNESHTDVITFDANGYPVSIVSDGFEALGTWTAAEETTEEETTDE